MQLTIKIEFADGKSGSRSAKTQKHLPCAKGKKIKGKALSTLYVNCNKIGRNCL